MKTRLRQAAAAVLVVVGVGLLIYSGLGFIITPSGHFSGWSPSDRFWITNGAVLILIGWYLHPRNSA